MPDALNPTAIADTEAEYGFLGCLIRKEQQKHIQRASEKVKPEHFSHTALGELWRAMCDTSDAREAFTAGGLRRLMVQSGVPDGMSADVITSVLQVYASENYEPYVNRLLSLARRRMLLQLSEQARHLAHLDDAAFTVDDRLKEVSESLAEIEGANPSSRKTRFNMDEAGDRAIETLQQAWRSKGGIVGLRTGLDLIDRRLLGLRPGCLYIAAGRPSMGKTVFGQTVAYNVAREGGSVVFLSQEMPVDQLHLRLMARRLRMSTDAMQETRDPLIVQRIHKAKAAISNLPIVIDDAARQTVGKMTGWLSRRRSAGKLDLLIVDYIGLMGTDGKSFSKVHQIEEITQGLKNLAKDLEIPVLALCQLSRALENREGSDRRPQLSDLRDSGAIEQDADAVMMLFREEYYQERKEPQQTGDHDADAIAWSEWKTKLEACKDKAEIHVPKNRQGKVGFDTFEFSGAFQEFANLEPDQ